MSIFKNDYDRMKFLCRVEELVSLGVLIVHTFCLMANHFHLLCETPVAKLGRWLQLLLSKYARGFNWRHSRAGHLLQARYKALLVESGEYFLECSRYIHLNPVRAGIVRCAEEYPWSSYRSYIALDPVFDWVETKRVIAEAGGLESYRAFVDAGLEVPDSSPFERAAGGIFFGSEGFIEKMRPLVRRPGHPGDLSGYRSLNRLQPQQIEYLSVIVDDVFRDLSDCKRRRVLIFALRQLSLLTGREIAELVGRSEATVSEVCHAIDRRKAGG